jgi:hypothetical protein
MNFRDAARSFFGQSKASAYTNTSSVNRRATAIAAVVLFLLAGFAIGRFVVNFAQLQRLAEESNGSIGTESTASSDTEAPAPIPPPGATRDAVPAQDLAALEPWLGPLNRYRKMVGIAPVTADRGLSRGDFLHSQYLVMNFGPQLPSLQLGAMAHTEDPARPWFSAEGLRAAGRSDVDWMWDPHSTPQPSWAIDNWMQVPFHRLQIINPNLVAVGYGTLCRSSVCFAALNTGSDIDSPPPVRSAWPRPLEFPPDGSAVTGGAFEGEWPDPLTSCAGYTSPAGLPITLELGYLDVPGISNYSVRASDASGALLDACAFDANTYVNSDPAAQATGRGVLRQFGAIVIVPRKPLSLGGYAVAVTAGEHQYSWAFRIGK